MFCVQLLFEAGAVIFSDMIPDVPFVIFTKLPSGRTAIEVVKTENSQPVGNAIFVALLNGPTQSFTDGVGSAFCVRT